MANFTKNCVHCFKPAVVWRGHVLTEDGCILAGWCKKHEKTPDGFYGHYRKEMGKRR